VFSKKKHGQPFYINIESMMTTYISKKERKKVQKIIGVYGRVYTPYGWHSHSKVMKNYKKLLPTMLTTTQTNLIVGLLLSDASIDRNSKGQLQPRVRFGQNIQRKERTFYFHDMMQPFVSAPPRIAPSTSKLRKDGSFSDASLVFTLSSPVFQKFADLFYISYGEKVNQTWGHKVIRSELVDYMNAEVLAFWFAGDGCRQKDSKHMTKAYIRSTGLLNKSDLERLIQMIYFKFGFKPTIQKDKENYRLYILKKHTALFRSLIEPFLLQCCKYKL
jgi:hypothetical protein